MQIAKVTADIYKVDGHAFFTEAEATKHVADSLDTILVSNVYGEDSSESIDSIRTILNELLTHNITTATKLRELISKY